MVERLVRNEKARGSNPLTSNDFIKSNLRKIDRLLTTLTLNKFAQISQCLRVCFCCTTSQNLSVCFSSCQTLRTPYKWPPSGPTKVIWIPANSSRTRSGRDQSGCESQNDAPGIFPGNRKSLCHAKNTSEGIAVLPSFR